MNIIIKKKDKRQEMTLTTTWDGEDCGNRTHPDDRLLDKGSV